MGNSDSNTNQSMEAMLKEYRQVRKQNNGIVLEDANHQNTFFFKEITFVDKNQFDKELKRFQKLQKQDPQENRLNLIKVSAQQFNNFCSNSYKIYAVYQYPSVTLEDQIIARSKEEKYFEECQLWSILQSCANGLDSTKPSFSIHPKYVFVMPDGVLKVICNDLIEEYHRCIIKEYIYYAPEKITNFHQVENQTNLKKQAIFSLGMTLLHAAILKPVNICYNYQRFEFFEDQLEECIKDLVSHGYSEDLIEILAMMLEPNPSKRASLLDVHGILSKFCNSETEENPDQQQDANQQQMSQRNQNFERKPSMPQQTVSKLNLIENQFQQRPSRVHQQMQSIPSHTPYYVQSIPQYAPPPSDKQNLFTDPKLLEMIRKDLEDISQLKRNSLAKGPAYSASSYQYSNLPQSYIQSYNVNTSYNYQQFQNESHKMSKSGSSVNINKSIPASQNISRNSSKQISPKKEVLAENNGNQQEQGQGLGFSKAQNNGIQKSVYIREEFQDGRKFQGNIVNGVKQGYGKLTYSDGAYYEGDFHENRMEGKGVLYYMPGRPAYDGEWLNDQFHGFGVLYNESPMPLSGFFKYDDFNLIEDYWVRYEGNFDSDNKCGQGKLFLSTGQQFHGQFDNDSINGQGVFLAKNDRGEFEQIHGIWQQNVLVQLLEDHA